MAKKKARGGSLIYLILDRSGSMAAIYDATIDGLNLFLDETRKADPAAHFSLTLFDHEVQRVYTDKPLTEVEKIDRHVYQIRGNTALLDAVGTAVSDIDKMEAKPEKIVLVVMTDGQENASREYTREAVKSLISDREKQGWQVLFLGANVDAFSEAGAIGMRAAHNTSATWQPTYAGTVAAYAVAASNASSYTSGITRTANITQDAYDQTLAAVANNAGSVPQQPILTGNNTAGAQTVDLRGRRRK